MSSEPIDSDFRILLIIFDIESSLLWSIIILFTNFGADKLFKSFDLKLKSNLIFESWRIFFVSSTDLI